ncbi:MAG: ATP-dependent RNA helicase SrmB [Candidatus Methanofastidiosum methylothiophilum]|uniref:ATP-dependent RNA helicase SrmB n=1 Tax=Candidatus Methanofastidiosum methylothiophilum TaxID=1705564 RepID=A0A150ING5_9EURY|nr:MAG: ATP-dependent RNA helicase SrmB [Candidatus Methanofastidiosum methylthiophilus]KYC47151.1 MAG: ATP-dependent RNA helicase SrmB [Candidatus Methanofastidiosum methylthiophilus]KYC49567.1 MAG: ATP-dependent RNA helicase SrmB [Candidatus Methanofastidiosum methylthiophilus]
MPLSHPLIKGEISPRAYQETIFVKSKDKNTLVILPTGLGKTYIGILLSAYTIQTLKKKVLVLAPTKPLAEQHLKSFSEVLNIDRERFSLLTGTVSPSKRDELYKESIIVIATPQVIENDILNAKINLDEFGLIIFDEAHRATGDYAYTYIAEKSISKNIRILALTASPASNREKMQDIIKNLGIDNIEIRNEYSPDVKPYIQNIDISWVSVKLPDEFLEIKKMLELLLRKEVKILKELGFVSSQEVTKKQILDTVVKINNKIKEVPIQEKSIYYGALKSQAKALKIYHALELLETQGLSPLISYFKRMREGKSRSSIELLSEKTLMKIITIADKLNQEGLEHPKLSKLYEIVIKEVKAGKNIIVFSHYRDTTMRIVNELKKFEGIKVERFVGQASKKGDDGLSQKKQKEIIENFRLGGFNVLVATSVGEEGLDIPEVDMVILFEPVPSEIRTIQRRGRTARKRSGEVVILMAEKTRDEGYYWASKKKERQMKNTVMELKRDFKKSDQMIMAEKGQSKLKDFLEMPEIIADDREDKKLLKILSENSILKLNRLEVGDYILSNRVGIERKSSNDFIESLIKGTLFPQILSLSNIFEVPILIVEGEDIYSIRNMDKKSIRGAIISAMVDFRTRVVFTKNSVETANFLVEISLREQKEKDRMPAIRGDKKIMSLNEKQLFVVQGLPDVSSVLSRRLLRKFGSVLGVFNADELELKEVEGVGDIKAKKIREVIDSKYEEI